MTESDFKHVTVREHLRALVVSSPAGAPAPSERSLVAQFGVARMTVRQAIEALVAEGVLVRKPGRGTFVGSKVPHAGDPVLGLAEEMAIRGVSVTSETLVARTEAAGPGVANGLGIAEGRPVVHIRRLRSVEDGPLCVEDVYVNSALVRGLATEPVPERLYEALAEVSMRPDRASDKLSASTASEEMAELLAIDVGAPVLQQIRRASVGAQVVLVARTVFRSDRHTVQVNYG